VTISTTHTRLHNDSLDAVEYSESPYDSRHSAYLPVSLAEVAGACHGVHESSAKGPRMNTPIQHSLAHPSMRGKVKVVASPTRLDLCRARGLL